MIRVPCLVENLTGRPDGSVVPRRVPDGCGWVFVPNNGGVITSNLNRLSTKKKTEGLQYQKAVTPRARRTYQGCHESAAKEKREGKMRRESSDPERRLRRCRPGNAACARTRQVGRRTRRADRGRLPWDLQPPQPPPVGRRSLGAGHLLGSEARQHFRYLRISAPPLPAFLAKLSLVDRACIA